MQPGPDIHNLNGIKSHVILAGKRISSIPVLMLLEMLKCFGIGIAPWMNLKIEKIF